jgi:hypothetical protein
MPPSYTRTWQYLMDKRRNDLPPDDIISPDIIPDIETLDSDKPQAASDLADTDNLGTPILDVYGQPDHIPLPARKTRSGRAYFSLLKATHHVCPQIEIAPPDPFVSAPVIDLRGQVQSELAALLATTVDGLPVGPAHTKSSLFPGQVSEFNHSLVPSETSPELDPLPRKTVSFDSHRDVRLFTLDSTVYEHRDFSQVCTALEQHISELVPKTYIMANCASIDHSLREVFYQASFTSPLANLLALEEEENDFNY